MNVSNRFVWTSAISAQMGKRARRAAEEVRRHSWEFRDEFDGASLASWENHGEEDNTDPQKSQFGDYLAKLLIGEFARGQMTATMVCELSFYAVSAGALGDALQELSLCPGSVPDGGASRHLLKVLPQSEAVPLCTMKVPMNPTFRREVRWSALL